MLAIGGIRRNASSLLWNRRMMSRRARWLWAGLVLGFTLLGRVSVSWARDDFQSWNTLEISKRFGSQWELFFLPELRIRHDASQLFYHEYRQGVRWKPSKYLQVGLNYLFARNASSGKTREEHTGELDVTPKMTIGSLDGSLRVRVALRTIQGSSGEQEWQVRLMPKLAYPTQLAGHKVTLYVADDLFYDYTRDAWNQNRVFLGVSTPLGKAHGVEVLVDVYYMVQSQLGARRDWSSNHILGTKLTLRL